MTDFELHRTLFFSAICWDSNSTFETFGIYKYTYNIIVTPVNHVLATVIVDKKLLTTAY